MQLAKWNSLRRSRTLRDGVLGVLYVINVVIPALFPTETRQTAYLIFIVASTLIAVLGIIWVSHKTFFSTINIDVKELESRFLTFREAETYYRSELAETVVFFIAAPILVTILSAFSNPIGLISIVPLMSIIFLWNYFLRREQFNALLKNLHEYLFDLASFVNPAAINQIKLPIKCHSGDSHNIQISLNFNYDDHCVSNCIEVELQAAGFNVHGNLKQQQPFKPKKGTYLWNCNFATPGVHRVNFLFRLLSPSHEVKKELGCRSFKIRVVSLYRQYAIPTVLVVLSAASLLYATRYDILTGLKLLGLI